MAPGWAVRNCFMSGRGVAVPGSRRSSESAIPSTARSAARAWPAHPGCGDAHDGLSAATRSTSRRRLATVGTGWRERAAGCGQVSVERNPCRATRCRGNLTHRPTNNRIGTPSDRLTQQPRSTEVRSSSTQVLRPGAVRVKRRIIAGPLRGLRPPHSRARPHHAQAPTAGWRWRRPQDPHQRHLPGTAGTEQCPLGEQVCWAVGWCLRFEPSYPGRAGDASCGTIRYGA
jgi:hypothetical protein